MNVIDQKSEHRDPSRIEACANKYDAIFDVGSSYDNQDVGFTLTILVARRIRVTTC